MDLPLPFCLRAGGDFATCHLSKMSNKEFFGDGLWSVGYSVGFDEEMGFDPAIHLVELTATQNNAHSSVLSLRGSGFDQKGSFKFGYGLHMRERGIHRHFGTR